MSGVRALPLLCKKSRTLPPDVLMLVRQFLCVQTNNCPRWISQLLWQKIDKLPQGRHSGFKVTFNLAKTIDFGTYRTQPVDLDESGPKLHKLQPYKYMPRFETSTSPVHVKVKLIFTELQGHWELSCTQDNNLARAYVDLWWMDSIPELLSTVRGYFDARCSIPSGWIEVPTTWRDWRAFMHRWLFGPPAFKQTTLDTWLGRSLTMPEQCCNCGQICKKTITPDAERLLGNPLCSKKCLKEWDLFTCSRCNEPLNSEHELCWHWECRHGIGMPERF